MYSDEEIRRIIIAKRREERRRRMRRRVITKCTILIVILLAIIVGISMLVTGCRERMAKAREPLGVIFLDPGHGGVDSGTDAGGRYEKDDTLKLALAIKDELEAANYIVYMSRTEDVDVDRDERGAMANSHEADLCISIHRNQASEGNGAEIWLPSANTKEQQILGEHLMKAFVECGFMERSMTAGVFGNPNDDYYENSVPKMPCCLCEVGFTSSKKDNKIFDKVEENAPVIAEAIIGAHKEIYKARYEERGIE